MTVKQISVFLENQPGRLAEFTDRSSARKSDRHARALCLAEAPDFASSRVIVDDPYEASCVLKEAGYVFSITPVLAVAIPDEAGSLCEILHILGEHDINIDYTYAFTARKHDLAYMIVRVADNEKKRPSRCLAATTSSPVSQEELISL